MKYAVSIKSLAACLSAAQLTAGHFVTTYPGWRGTTFVTNPTFPDGMQSVGPCGGLGVSNNRTAWPIGDFGAIALQPGWFANNQYTQFSINLGIGPDPANFPWVMHEFLVTGPTNSPFPGTICLPQVPFPRDVVPVDGDFATIQITQLHVSGNTAHNCVDIVFRKDPTQIPPLNETNCFNTTGISVDPLSIFGIMPGVTDRASLWPTDSVVSSSSLLDQESVTTDVSLSSVPTSEAVPTTTTEASSSAAVASTEVVPPAPVDNGAAVLLPNMIGLLGCLAVF